MSTRPSAQASLPGRGTAPSHAPTAPARLVVLIPAYRPDARLPRLVTSLRRDLEGVQVLVVDDGSGPAWADVFDEARQRGAEVLSYPVNAGKGRALRRGLARAADAWPGADVVCADADGQHTPSDIAAVAGRVRESGRMTLGVREFTSPVPARSRIGNDVTALLFRGATGWRLRDTQTGLRGYPAGGYGWMLEVPGDRYEYELSALLRAHEMGLEVEQVGIETVYEPGNTSSRFRPLRDSARIYAPLLRFTGASLGGFFIDWLMVLLLHALTGSLLAAVAGARLVSGASNFAMNRRVFRATGPLWRTGVRYVLLAVGLVAASYLGLAVLTGAGAPLALAKPVVDGLLYLASYTLQRRVVFREHG
ncbi:MULTISPECIES: bifunctional glycosyltransferase family 2/GtrA family protein [unclassified Actinomyces]|uniref:bifunctional glycosyltransferase family 2/GtrA family protein n=1 Tax=unclassified Actinomyces TaxID=2609248 RepID=UPI002016A95A|nr:MULTISPECIES: bifunctional glycosyltransferase family 2/GtrA family protein [unclassified Actinomyces]MCL3777209.1 bifunctional glycosyltransferase family 2/GtrA family protein [Actinomyces sp. AC-20-1]MCL3789284.1 bifunctional glycosyltransferase family 2/GtrA family protein [Actinomyces sp. 187325]MCL3791704.1 bifunctional glycosyltransferase family 2/GtrA family protein [Actinomyces sp. 186855]MCL3794256.1 bifunctional glycosyltransferase family 2/GtrA family protein [Actinomyces sp. 2178